MLVVVRFFIRAVPMIFCTIIMLYLGYHVSSGKFGLHALARMETEERELRNTLDRLQKEKDEMEARVALLRPESIDPDMLDERVRATLNFAHPDDIVFLRSGS